MTKSELITEVEGFFDTLDAASLSATNIDRLNILDLIRRNKLDSAIIALDKVCPVGMKTDICAKVESLIKSHSNIKTARALAKEAELSSNTEPQSESKYFYDS